MAMLSSRFDQGHNEYERNLWQSVFDDSEQCEDRFIVANIEVWTLTLHGTVAEAEQSELSTLFLDGGRDGKCLNLMNIISGGLI